MRAVCCVLCVNMIYAEECVNFCIFNSIILLLLILRMKFSSNETPLNRDTGLTIVNPS